MLAEAVQQTISVLVCDDHRLLTETLTAVLGRDPAIAPLVPAVHSPEEAIEVCRTRHPNVVLMDIEFKSSMSGIEATRRIKAVSPTTKVVVMTAHEEDRLLVEAVEAGASGFLRKTEGVDELLATVKAAAAGEILIDQAQLARLLPRVAREREVNRDAQLLLSQLTPREREILQLLGQGMRNEAVGAALYISPQTVQTHIRNILTKLGVHSKLEAVVFALRHGAISL
ncbi:MAG TPA: response regulator transcription factor [Actinomycetota bacterium]|nr:response regulator transcription factor [Actinomycetota bacterium]